MQLAAIACARRHPSASHLYVAGQVGVQRMSVIVLHRPGRGLFLLPVVIHLDIAIQGVPFDCGLQGYGCNVFPKGFVYHFLTDAV